MKVYVLDESNGFVYDENRNRRYVDVAPCPKCAKYQWEENERIAVQKAVELIFSLADFKCAAFHKAGGCISSSDWGYRYQLGGPLINPTPNLCEYDSDRIRVLKEVIELAGFAGASDIDIKSLIDAYQVIQFFVAHLHNEHREERIIPPQPPFEDCPRVAAVPIAQYSWFEPAYVQWVGVEDLFHFLPDIRGKSQEEISAYLKKKYDQIEQDHMQKVRGEEV